MRPSFLPKYEKIPPLPNTHYWSVSDHPIDVPISKVKGNQYQVYGDRVDRLAKKLKDDPHNHRAFGYHHPDGTLYLHDGYHTLEALNNNGETHVRLTPYVAKPKE